MKLGHELAESRARWPSLTDELLAELEAWTVERRLPKPPREQLAIFAHSCYYDKAATLQCMDVYYRMRANVPEFFADRDPLLDSMKYTLKVV